MFQNDLQLNESVGIGIGLSTADALASSLGGQIEIISPLFSDQKINKGTEVSFEIRCA